MKARAAEFIAWARPRRAVAGTLIVAVLFALGFIVATFTGDAHPSSTFGLAAGIAAALTLVAVMLYSARRSRPHVRKYGPAALYLELHLWGGALFGLLLLIHTAFALPRSLIGWTLWLPALWVVVTGAIGTFLQRMLPRFLAATETFEVNLARAPELVAQLQARAAELAVQADARVRAFHDREIAPGLAQPGRSLSAVLRNPRGVPGSAGAAEMLRKTLDPAGVTALDALLEIQRTKHEIDAHVGVQRILRGWLVLHLPVAVTLLVVVVLHILFILYY